MKLLIKNMVCRHCVDKVSNVLDELGFRDARVDLGVAEFNAKEIDDKDLMRIGDALESEGFELIHSREAAIVEGIKHTLIEESRKEGGERISIADALTAAIPMSYQQLSRIFTEVEGRSIENYFLNLRIERVKELIRYANLSLSEIAFRTGFSSVAHLSRQFKQLTGLTPSQFREIGKRKPLQEV